MNLLAYSLISGVLYGMFFALIGLGLNLIFGVMRIVNLAHGDFLMLGAYAALLLFALLDLSPLAALPIIAIFFFVLGGVVYFLTVPRLLHAEDPELMSFVLFFGVSQFLEAIIALTFGNGQRSLPDSAFGSQPIAILGQAIPQSWIYTAAISALAIFVVFAYLRWTSLGYATRAVMSDRGEAANVGINVSKISAINFGIGIALAAIPGCFSSYIVGSITPSMGIELTVTAFAVVIMGSLGRPLGTVLGGVIYGLAIALMQTYLPSWSNMLPNALVIVIMLFRPYGLLGHRELRHA